MKRFEAHYNGPELRGAVTGNTKAECIARMNAKVAHLDPKWEDSVTYFYWNGEYLKRVD